jgi:hypothetical protein
MRSCRVGAVNATGIDQPPRFSDLQDVELVITEAVLLTFSREHARGLVERLVGE